MYDWLEQIDHTADIGIIVHAENLPQLFTRAARAMFEIIADLDNVGAVKKVAVTVEAADVEALMVRWLSELNFRHITDEIVFADFEIRALDATRLHAEAVGEPIDLTRHTIHTEIKAITYHGLRIEQCENRWQAKIIFDM